MVIRDTILFEISDVVDGVNNDNNNDEHEHQANEPAKKNERRRTEHPVFRQEKCKAVFSLAYYISRDQWASSI